MIQWRKSSKCYSDEVKREKRGENGEAHKGERKREKEG